jgi:NADH dehydrogenase FAD-containing subunit
VCSLELDLCDWYSAALSASFVTRRYHPHRRFSLTKTGVTAGKVTFMDTASQTITYTTDRDGSQTMSYDIMSIDIGSTIRYDVGGC